MIATALTRHLGIQHPLIQAGMGSEAGARLAAAVSKAGGLGTIGSIGGTPDHLVEEIRACRAATDRPFAVNVVTWPWAPFAPDLLDVVLRERPPVVTLSFGEPLAALERCKAAGLKTLVQVQDLAGAEAALAAEPDAVIVQGNEAGGHTGRRGTLSFGAQVLDLAGHVPVAIAGGIATGRGLAAALALGAGAAVVGTRFKASEEFAGSTGSKDRIVASDGSNTLYDEIFDEACGLVWPHRVTGRALRNHFVARWEGRRAELRAAVGAEPLFAFVGELARDPEQEINWAGESAGLVRAIQPAHAIVAELVCDADRCLRASASLLD
jgi:nitronate monooxygenase